MMHITMPKVAIWQYLWLEATTLIDCEFQDFTTFGQVCPSALPVLVTRLRHLRLADAAFLWACSVPNQATTHTYAFDLFCRDCIQASSSTATYMANA